MSEEQQQTLEEYSYQVITLPNPVPLVPHNQATMLRDFSIYPEQEISQDDIFVPLPSVAYPAYSEPHRVGYPQYYGQITSSDGVTQIHHHTPCASQPAIAPAQPCGIATGPPFLDTPFGGMAENIPFPSERRPKRARQDSNDTGYNPAVPGPSIANIYRDLAARFINDPQSNISVVRMESSAGRSRVTIELEIVDAA